jgi:transcription elongation factor GreA
MIVSFVYNILMQNRPIHRTRFTKAGFEKLQKEYDELKNERPAVIVDVQKARELGDLKENGYYQASKAKLRSIDSRLMHISYELKTAKIIEENVSDSIGIGSTVLFSINGNEKTFQFVGDLEANPSEGKLSLLSPIGRAVEGKKVGDEVEVKTPSGVVLYTIRKVS